MIAVLSFSNSFAQLPDGSVAPDFTLTDLNGTSHSLYSYLDQGYTVFIDFSAVWCPPCWSYHQTHALEDLYVDHGPTGHPGVSGTTTDDVMVFYIEADANNVASLNGSGANTQGDWVTGTSYPIICTDGTAGNNGNAVSGDYAIGYFPTIYMICPDRLTTEVGALSNPYGSVASCPPPASSDNDARTFPYSGSTLTCGDLTPEITIQNYGLVDLTSLNIEVTVNGTTASTTPWTGNLSTYATQNVSLPVLTGLSTGDAVNIITSLPNGQPDADPSNNPNAYFNVTMVQTTNVYTDVTVNVTTDQYPSETTWDIVNSAGQTVAAGGPYSSQGAQNPVTTTLNQNECYFFTIYDSYGDGICCQYGQGSFSVTDAGGTVISTGGQFTTEDGEAFETGSQGGPVASWDCLSPTAGCQDPGTGNGQYSSLAACQAACTATSIEEENIDLSIYPSPVKDMLTIDGIYNSLEIYDIYGKLILTSDAQPTINVEALSDGIYLLNINTQKGVIVKRITIAK